MSSVYLCVLAIGCPFTGGHSLSRIFSLSVVLMMVGEGHDNEK